MEIGETGITLERSKLNNLPQLIDNAYFLVWGAPQGSHRSQFMAQALGIGIDHVYFTARQGRYYAPFKYIYQSIKTFQLLAKHRPKLIFVQNPPIFAPFIVYLYCLLSGSKFIIDSHTDALLASWWAWSTPLQKFLSRRAIATLVTNPHLEDMVLDWDASAFVMLDPPIYKPSFEEVTIDQNQFNIMVVSSVSYDEPIHNILEAAKLLPGVHFFITGKYQERRPDIVEIAPENVSFTGFLSDAQFYGLMKSVQTVMCLTMENHTLQSGANEALWMGKPIITSNWPILIQSFGKGTIHINNSVDSICSAVQQMRRNINSFEQEILEYQEDRKQNWEDDMDKLIQLILEKFDS
jgi:glycosyltransferase involved in cell wall biosynthesis